MIQSAIPNNNKPWLLDESQLEIIDVYEAEIIKAENNNYLIEFRDAEMEVIEATLPKKEFEHHPEPIEPGTTFGIVLYRQVDDPATKIGAWPAEKYWNKRKTVNRFSTVVNNGYEKLYKKLSDRVNNNFG